MTYDRPPDLATAYAELDDRRHALEEDIRAALVLHTPDDLGRALRAERLAHLNRLLVGLLAELETIAWGDVSLPPGYAAMLRWAREGVARAAGDWDENAAGWRELILDDAERVMRQARDLAR